MNVPEAKSAGTKIRSLRQIITSRPKIVYLLVILVALVIIDGLITEYLVGNDLAREGNPFLQELVGEWSFLAIKVVAAFLCAFILWDIYRRWSRLAVIGTSCLVACYGAIVIWNVIAYFIATD